MPGRCLLCYITDRTQFPGREPERRRALLAKIAEAVRWGVDYIQLREKDLETRKLEKLAREAVAVVRDSNLLRRDHSQLRTEKWELKTALPATRVLINSRTDVALAVGADGVHLRSDDVSPKDVRRVLQRCAAHCPLPAAHFFIAVSCHTLAEAIHAASDGADLAVFAPVFEKKDQPPAAAAGLERLREACQAGIPVLALGGVRLDNAASCVQAGAAGIAAIRLFQDHDLSVVIPALRQIAR
jgi:thiamine-phosphate pyrophosphorylase